MGASNSRYFDAELLLTQPKHTELVGRRLLDTSVSRCACCCARFTPLRRKHYCRRCGHIICESCSSFRHFRERDGPSFRICSACHVAPVLINVVPVRVWHRILAFAGNVAHHRTIQVCRKLQLAVPLPYRWGAAWDTFFTDGVFLSKGANGSVFRAALRSQSQTPVAVKVVHKNTIHSLRKWHHIQREIDTLRACRHKHVIELIDVMQSPEAVFIVLQFAHGGDLFDWLMARKAPSEAEVRTIAAQLLATLCYIHTTCNAVHRDIKPENILLAHKVRGAETPHILLADFGFARLFPGGAVAAAAAAAAAARREGGDDNVTSPATAASRSSGALAAERVAAPAGDAGVGAKAAGASPARGGNTFGVRGAVSAAVRVAEARPGGGAGGGAVTVAATPCGTLGFAAPEIIEAYSSRRELHRQLDEIEQRARKTPAAKLPRPRSTPDATAVGATGAASSPLFSPNGGGGGGGGGLTAAYSASSVDSLARSPTSATQGPMTPVELMKKMDIFAAGVTICILLTGCEPFPCDSSKAHLDAVARGVRFDGRHWAHVSMEARDMLRRMLHADAEKRPTAAELLQSPWLRAAAASGMNAAFLGGGRGAGTQKAGAHAHRGAPGGGSSAIAATVSAEAQQLQEELARSFQQSLRSLRKNDGTVFTTDQTGVVRRTKRGAVVEETLFDDPPPGADVDAAGSPPHPAGPPPCSGAAPSTVVVAEPHASVREEYCCAADVCVE